MSRWVGSWPTASLRQSPRHVTSQSLPGNFRRSRLQWHPVRSYVSCVESCVTKSCRLSVQRRLFFRLPRSQVDQSPSFHPAEGKLQSLPATIPSTSQARHRGRPQAGNMCIRGFQRSKLNDTSGSVRVPTRGIPGTSTSLCRSRLRRACRWAGKPPEGCACVCPPRRVTQRHCDLHGKVLTCGLHVLPRTLPPARSYSCVPRHPESKVVGPTCVLLGLSVRRQGVLTL